MRDQDRTEQYLENMFNGAERLNVGIISGWIEFKDFYCQAQYEKTARNTINSQLIGTTCYHDSSRIVFIHKDQMKPEWKTRFNLSASQTQNYLNSMLYFIIVTRKEKLSGDIEYIVPRTRIQKRIDSWNQRVAENHRQDVADDNLHKKELDECNDRSNSTERDYKSGKQLKGNKTEIGNDIIASLVEMNPEEIFEFAKSLDQSDRKAIMASLLERSNEESKQSEKSPRIMAASEDVQLNIQRGFPAARELDLIGGIKIVDNKLEIPRKLLETLQDIPGLGNTLNLQGTNILQDDRDVQLNIPGGLSTGGELDLLAGIN